MIECSVDKCPYINDCTPLMKITCKYFIEYKEDIDLYDPVNGTDLYDY